MDHYACDESALRRRAVSLAAAALLAAAMVPCRPIRAQEAPATRPAGAAEARSPASAPAPGTAKQSEAATMPGRGLLARSRPSGPTTLRTQDGIGGSEAIWRMLASMLVITVLGLLCYVMVKRVVPRIARPGGRNLRVLESACLDRGQRVHVLGVGADKYLVASSRQGVTMLANVTAALDRGDDRPAGQASGGRAQTQ